MRYLKQINLAGNAGVGKDTICNIMISRIAYIHNLKASRVALADPLKSELSSFIFKTYGINIFSCSPKEKAAIRPILVAHGKVRRTQTNGTYWTKLAQIELDKNYTEGIVSIVTDIRYAEYEKDELYWCKEENKSPLIFLERVGIEPANEDELLNNDRLKKEADFVLEVPNVENLTELIPLVDVLLTELIWIQHLITAEWKTL